MGIYGGQNTVSDDPLDTGEPGQLLRRIVEQGRLIIDMQATINNIITQANNDRQVAINEWEEQQRINRKLKKRLKELEKEVDQANHFIGEILLRLEALEGKGRVTVVGTKQFPECTAGASFEPTFKFTLPKQERDDQHQTIRERLERGVDFGNVEVQCWDEGVWHYIAKPQWIESMTYRLVKRDTGDVLLTSFGEK